MRERSSTSSVTDDAQNEPAETPAPSTAVASPPASGAPAQAASVAAPTFVTASHAALFEDDTRARCDICGDDVPPDPDDGSSYAGSALYISMSGDRVVYDEPPLCASCAVAVGVTALARWDIEEEEG